MVELGEPGTQAPKDLVGFLNFYLVTRAPFQIPDGAKEFLVRFGPWLIVVALVLMLPAALLVLGLGAIVAPFAGISGVTGFGFLGLGLLVQFGLTAAALPGLFARKLSGWTLLLYAQLVSIVFSLLGGHIVAAVIGGLISLYLLFQVRSLYKA